MSIDTKELQDQVYRLEAVLTRHGFRRCNIAACNCGSWHHVDGLAARFREIEDVLRDADVLDNSTGNLPVNAIKKLVEQRDTLRAERAKWVAIADAAEFQIKAPSPINLADYKRAIAQRPDRAQTGGPDGE